MQDLLREMRQTFPVFQTTDMIQNMIYFFNQPSVRDHVIKIHTQILPAGKKVRWDGTYFFNEKGDMDPFHHQDLGKHPMSFQEFLTQRKVYQKGGDDCRFILSTCCVTYEGNRVHFLSLIYDKKKQVLVFFDPGIHLYEKGQDAAVPIVSNAFRNNKLAKKIERLGLCAGNYHGKRWGIQYDGGSSKLPADSFCQSWSLYYLVEFLRNKCSDKFFPLWCSIPPERRETFIMMNFFMPHLQNHPFLYEEWKNFYPNGDMSQLNRHVIQLFSKQ